MFHVKHPEGLGEGLARYAELIHRYHRTLDLMSERALESLPALLAEGARYAELITPAAGERLLDLGSGVGLPGIPLALAYPEHPVTLVERRQRRSSFLRLAVGQLGLANVTVVSSDVRTLRVEPIRWISAQAVGRFALLYRLTAHLHAETVTLVARRGPDCGAELDELAAAVGLSPTVTSTVTAIPLEARGGSHGRLVAVQLAGGRSCRSSGSSTRRAG